MLLSIRPKNGVWKWQLLLGIPLTAGLVGLTAILVDGLALIPYQFPNSYYLWVGLVFFALTLGIIGWRRFRNWERVVSVLAVALTASMAFVLINKQYQYYPTVGALFGVEAQNEVSLKQLDEIRARARMEHGGALPTEGFTIDVPIPGAVSKFQARNALVWLPPEWVVNEQARLPAVMLLEGTPGAPDDWTRAAFVDQTARDFADAHGGKAPILVMPDSNGSTSGDTECVNSPRGNAETYLTVDVPKFLRTHFGAKDGKHSIALAGLSEGGMCSAMLTLRHPDLFQTFADYSGLTGPTVGESFNRARTTEVLFGGSAAAYAAHDPVDLLTNHRFPDLAAWYEVGSDDSAPLQAQRTLVRLSVAAGIRTCYREVPGLGHDFFLWSEAFKDSLPFLSYHLQLTPKPSDEPATCRN